MNKTEMKIAILGIVALFAVLTVSTASAHVTLYFVPQDTSVPEGECHSANVEVWLSTEDPDTALSGQFAIHYDPSCVNITEHPVYGEPEGWGECIDYTMSSWNAYPECYGDGYDMIMYTFAFPIPHPPWCPSPQMIANFTVHCCNSSIEHCLTNLSISCGRICNWCPIQILDAQDINLYPDNTTFINGTFECGVPPTFTKHLEPGWNLISLPLFNVSNMTVANIIDESVGTSNYDALYKYNASTHSFVPLSSTDEMENGAGYFINITNPAGADWTYKGAPVTSMDVSMEQGLNMIGWLNCTKRINQTSLGDTSKVRYIARWNVTSQSYEVYEPHALDVFNDFWTLERGEGYFVAAKTAFTLSESC